MEKKQDHLWVIPIAGVSLYIWAIIVAGIVAILAITIPFFIIKGSKSDTSNSPHSAEELANYQSIDNTPRIEAYKDILRENPNDVMVLNDLGTMYLQLGRYQEALEIFQKAIVADPNNPEFYGGLAESYYSLRMSDLATREIEKGLAIDPKNQYLLILNGDILATQGKQEDAKVMWQKVVDSDPSTYFAQLAQARLSGQAGTASSSSGSPNPHETGEIPLE